MNHADIAKFYSKNCVSLHLFFSIKLLDYRFPINQENPGSG
ncbi:hypothetical protein Leryth_014016 [Lithospermum erythrorhizon]|nr:hypothetical protein Leryth_014016 [Lithospermum erythrorhizon]